MSGPKKIDHPGIVLLMPTRGRLTVETTTSMGAVDGVPTIFLPCPRKGIIEARNELAEAAIKFTQIAPIAPKLGWFALWVDDDAFWTAGTFMRMLNALCSPGVDILAGWFSGRAALSRPKASKLDGSAPTMDDYYNGRLVEVAGVGFHFVMHRIELLEKLGPNPFDIYGGALSEDISFCIRAREAGLRIWVHCGCPIAHIDDDGTAYLPGEPPHRVVGGELQRIEAHREYGGLDAKDLAERRLTSAVLLV